MKLAAPRFTSIIAVLVLVLSLEGSPADAQTGFPWSSSSSSSSSSSLPSCLPVTTVENLDLATYASAPWYVQQQAENAYTPIERNRCVTAQYKLRDPDSTGFVWWNFNTWWGYTVDVFNYAEDEDEDGASTNTDPGSSIIGASGSSAEMDIATASSSSVIGANLCADYDPDTPSQLKVAPCFLPKFLAGPYWIVAYREGPTDGYALVSGGQPTIPNTDETDCGPQNDQTCCATGGGVNNSGLWILTRQTNPDEALVDEVRALAKELGYSTSVLFDVIHDEDCNVPGIGGAGDEDEDEDSTGSDIIDNSNSNIIDSIIDNGSNLIKDVIGDNEDEDEDSTGSNIINSIVDNGSNLIKDIIGDNEDEDKDEDSTGSDIVDNMVDNGSNLIKDIIGDNGNGRRSLLRRQLE